MHSPCGVPEAVSSETLGVEGRVGRKRFRTIIVDVTKYGQNNLKDLLLLTV